MEKHFSSNISENFPGNYGTSESAYLYPTLNPSTGKLLTGSERAGDVTTSVKALYDYTAQRFDELSFVKHAIITNVQKNESGWWRGDYGGKRQHLFPANYVQEVVIASPEVALAGSSSEAFSSAEKLPKKGMFFRYICCYLILILKLM